MTDIEQGTDEWFQARLGKVTASRVSDVIAKTKTGYSASRANYAAQLVAERLTGQVADSYTNAAMQWGIDHEGDARAAYQFMTDVDVATVGFVGHPFIAMSGASPDGLVNGDGLVEIKCPNTATHIETLLNCAIPKKYRAQMQWQMACTERDWCDFVSYDPRMPERMQLFVKRIQRDAEFLTEIETEIVKFLGEVDDTVSRLQSEYSDQEPADSLLMAG